MDLINLSPAAEAALQRLEQNGFEAYAVGGCVRDSLLGRTPNDWDLTTNARPEEILACFPDCRPVETGRRHGTITVLWEGEPLEITTYRRDGAYADNRHPVQVTFSDTVEDDLARRDFTVNAMAYHPGRGLCDPFGGKKDLRGRVIRCVGEPVTRFCEDGLRILRAVRFAATLEFAIAPDTANAVRDCRALLDNIARERVRIEWDKLLLGAGAVPVLRAFPEIVGQIFPEVTPCFGFAQNSRYHCFDVWEHPLAALEYAKADHIVRLALFFHDIGKPAVSPYRDRPVEENLDLFERMKNGEFPEGSRTLRAKIDLASGNFNMRDPVIYRIRYMHHHRQGDKWCIYPMYDFAHPIQDALEGITHSLCSLEFEAHRPLYDWVVNNVSVPNKPRQIEFARLGIDHTVMSKRKLRKLVEEGIVSGWDDPRMPTLCGLRRRGFTPASIRSFCDRIGVAKSASVVEYSFLEHCLREDLNEKAERTMGVLHPVKLVITNYPEGKSETVTVENNPTDPASGTHEITFSRECWIEADDFMEVPVPKYKRLTPNGPECRLKGAYLITCTGCKKDENGNVVEVYAEYDPNSPGGDPADGRKVKGATIHWVDAATALDAEVRVYSELFSDPAPDGADKDFLACMNPDSLEVLTGCKVEPRMRDIAAAYDKTEKKGKTAPSFQFMRLGYFCLDNKDCSEDHLVFNRSVTLKDSFKK